MRRIVLALVAIAMLVSSTPAAAITNGELDSGRHPQVGLVVFKDADGVPLWRCSGTLLSERLLLTAGHCTAPDGPDVPASAVVWFSDNVPLGTGTHRCNDWTGYPCNGGVTGTPKHHPDFGFQNFPNTRDVGVVELDTPVTGVDYATLAPLGFLDSLATKRGLQSLKVTAVGYGLQSVRPTLSQLRTRYVASQTINDLRSALTDGYNLRTTSSPGNGTGDGYTKPGGTCFGDSGGPVFYGGISSLVIVGITSFGLNANCKGGDYAFRADIAETQDFVYGD